MATTHQSQFRYTIERPYPFRWFTPLITILGICAAVLFTFVNIAANGYVQNVIYTTNPNSTLQEYHWYYNPPWSWISTARSSCQSPGISIGSSYYTSNQQTGSYTVSMMNTTLGPGEDAVYPGLESKTLGITTYLNNTLHGCHMGDLMLIFTSQQQPNSAKLQIQTGPIYCTIDTDIPINITVEQSFSGTEFLFEQRSSFSQWSVYDFMHTSFDLLMDEIHSLNSTIDYTGTTLSLTTSGVADITADDFFSATILSPGQSASLVSPSTNNTDDESFPLAQGEPSDLVRLLDAFVKSYYSVVMWDLNFEPGNNAFASEVSTNYLVGTIMDATSNGSIVPNPILGTPGLLGNPAQFEMQYICSVPKKKDTGSLVISVFVANIVILSVFWNIFNWFALRYLRSHDPDWNVCAGCRLNSDSSRARVRDMDQDSLCGDDDAAHDIRFGIQRDKEQDEKSWNKPKVSTRSDSFKSSESTLRTASRSSVHVYAGKPKIMDREGAYKAVVVA